MSTGEHNSTNSTDCAGLDNATVPTGLTSVTEVHVIADAARAITEYVTTISLTISSALDGRDTAWGKR